MIFLLSFLPLLQLPGRGGWECLCQRFELIPCTILLEFGHESYGVLELQVISFSMMAFSISCKMCTPIALTELWEIYTIVLDNPSPPKSSNWNHSTQLAYGFIYHMFEISSLHPSSSKGDQRQLSWLPTVFPHCYFWTPVTPAWSSPALLWQVSLVATSAVSFQPSNNLYIL